MGELTELALATISQAQRRVEVVGQNLANAATPAYKRRIAFSQLVNNGSDGTNNVPQTEIVIDNRSGKIVETGNATDFFLSGQGFFALRRDSDVIYSRRGQLAVDGEGRLVDSQGFALQLASGNDIIVKSGDFKVGVDGTVTDKGEMLGRIAVFAAVDGSGESGTENATDGARSQFAPVDNIRIRQGAFEASNVSTGDEMVAMVEALRRAESGQRVMNVYDDLMGRVITAFGENAR